MSDLESRLRDVLDERAADAPDAIGLAAGARRRLRRRRTTWVVAAAAVLAATVPLGLSQLAPGTDGTGRVADDPTATSGLPPGVIETGFRAESWHDVTFEVPVDWGYGGVTGWCAGGLALEEARPVVTRPDTMVATILCTPGTGYGVTIGSSELVDPAYPSGSVWQYDAEGVDTEMYPDGAWLGYWYEAGAIITVIAPDETTAQRLVDSAQRYTGADPHGCPATLGEAEATTITESYETFSICRYGPDDLLTASRLLIGTESQVAQDAIFSSPVRTADYDCPTEDDLWHTALLSSGGYVATAVTDASCEGLNGLFMSGAVRDLTEKAKRHLDLSQLPVGQ